MIDLTYFITYFESLSETEIEKCIFLHELFDVQEFSRIVRILDDSRQWCNDNLTGGIELLKVRVKREKSNQIPFQGSDYKYLVPNGMDFMFRVLKFKSVQDLIHFKLRWL